MASCRCSSASLSTYESQAVVTLSKYIYFIVTCDFADSGVLAALMILTLFCWHTQHKSDRFHDSYVGCQLTSEGGEGGIGSCFDVSLVGCQLVFYPYCLQHKDNIKYLQECVHMHLRVGVHVQVRWNWYVCVHEMALV